MAEEDICERAYRDGGLRVTNPLLLRDAPDTGRVHDMDQLTDTALRNIGSHRIAQQGDRNGKSDS